MRVSGDGRTAIGHGRRVPPQPVTCMRDVWSSGQPAPVGPRCGPAGCVWGERWSDPTSARCDARPVNPRTASGGFRERTYNYIHHVYLLDIRGRIVSAHFGRLDMQARRRGLGRMAGLTGLSCSWLSRGRLRDGSMRRRSLQSPGPTPVLSSLATPDATRRARTTRPPCTSTSRGGWPRSSPLRAVQPVSRASSLSHRRPLPAAVQRQTHAPVRELSFFLATSEAPVCPQRTNVHPRKCMCTHSRAPRPKAGRARHFFSVRLPATSIC